MSAVNVDDDVNIDDDEELVIQHCATRQQDCAQFVTLLRSSVCVINDYVSLFCDKTPCMTSSQTGQRWLRELFVGHPRRFHNMFRMTKVIFFDLLALLEQEHGLKGTQRTPASEVLAITIYILGHNETFRKSGERFQHSTETLSRLFMIGLQALTNLSMHNIAPTDRHFRSIPGHIQNDERYMPFFKDCIGAIDGTHVDARIPVENQVPYIGRHGSTTQNVMAVCDFNMCFTYVVPGWEGSAHDTRIYHRAVRDPQSKFPFPPEGKYYLVDAGYPMEKGLLKPYPETRYHLPDFARGNRPIEGRREIFNKAHSSLRSVIERSFGVWKKKWAILSKMPQFEFSKQCVIVVVTMSLHNFIRRHPSRSDPEFDVCDENESFIHPEAYELRPNNRPRTMDPNPNSAPSSFEGTGATQMTNIREYITDQLTQYHR
ncbi:hypothetical protein KSP39_PZI002734 [Platanthera zijinensis]|uniref:DDE Tnp4 domain-containing protein n=1 Tax=Platanthera zijinensis TaxID=2320716 RepID=A0AAP0GET9_9ASPA